MNPLLILISLLFTKHVEHMYNELCVAHIIAPFLQAEDPLQQQALVTLCSAVATVGVSVSW